MTKRERAVKERAWLKTKVFCVTNSLDRKMTADTSLTDNQREWLAYIQSKVLTESRKAPILFVNIGAGYFKDRIRGNYKRWILYLKSIGELDVNTSYKAAGGDGWPMSYCIPKAALDSGVVKISFKRIKVQPPRAKAAQPSSDIVLEYVRKNLGKLTVAENLLVGPNAINDVLIHDSCWRIFFGDFNVRRGNLCQRLYHAVIEMVKEGRANLQFAESSVQLFEYDVKSCHPVLMLNLFTDSIERQRYAKLLESDVYTGITAAMGKPFTRDETKDVFSKAVNRSDRDIEALARNWVYQFFRQEFPTFTEQVLNVRTDLALFLQNEEAKLMVDGLGIFCHAHNYFWIPCHDGWMGTAEPEQQIISKVHELFHSYCGFPVAVSKLELIGRSTLSLFNSPLSGSYVGRNDTHPTPPLGKAESATPPANPWAQIIEGWKKQNDPTLLQDAALIRSEARERQKMGERNLNRNKEASKQLAKRVREVLENRDDLA